MPDREFTPKLGRIRDSRRAHALRHTARVIGEAAKAQIHTARFGGHIGPNALRRGLAQGSVSASGPFMPGTRRVIVKARYTRQKVGELGAARAHLRYIQRDGVTREGNPGRLYDAASDDADSHAFLERSENDPHQFRFIISAEDSDRLADLKPVIRDLMQQMQRDLGTKLDWIAVDHFNTGHPHTHVVIRGRDERGQDLVMARDYIGHGIRGRAQDLVTVELGPETELERIAKLTREVAQERFTLLDRSLLVRANDGVLTVSDAGEGDHTRDTLRVGRLKTLERLGLAEERRPGVWQLDPDLAAKLHRLGERADKIKMMQRALSEAGLDRSAAGYALFDRGARRHPLIGKVVGVGFVDEITDRHYVVVDGTDARVHYVELGRLKPENLPTRDSVVRIAADRLNGKPQSAPRLHIISHVPPERMAFYDGPVWLDRLAQVPDPSLQGSRGFGAELERAVAQRRQWLVAQDLARFRDDGGFELRTSAFARLRHRELQRLGTEAATRLQVPYRPVAPGEAVQGRVRDVIDAPGGKIVVIEGGDGVSVAPWSRRLENLRGREIAGTMSAHGLAIGRTRARTPLQR
jgi:type IV secretory pathway VirD2 relaxase